MKVMLSMTMFRSVFRRSRSLTVAMLVFLIAAAGASVITWRLEQARLDVERAHIAIHASHHAHIIERHIEKALSVTYALAALVRQGNGAVPKFAALAQEMLPFYPGVSALGLAPGGIVDQIVPLAGNEKAIGHNLLQDPARTREAFIARDTGKLTLAGPFNLLQGGLGAAGRLPVFLKDETGQSFFWGFVVVLLRFPDVLEPAQIAHMIDNNLNYVLWRIHPDTGQKQIIAASTSAMLIAPIEQVIEVPNATWTLSVSPVNGWSNPGWLALMVGLGLLFALLVAVLAKLLIDYQQAAKALQQSEERYRRLADDLPALVCQYLSDSTLTYVNRAYCHYFRKTHEELLGYRFLDFLPTEAVAATKGFYQSLTPDMPVHTYQHPVEVNGVIRWQEWTDRAFFNSQGESLYFQAVGQDITERKQVDAMIKTSEAQLQSIINASPVPLALNDDQQNIVFLNPAFVQTFGYTLEDIPTLSDWWLKAYPDPEYGQWVAETWQLTLERAKREGTAFSPIEVQIRCKTGAVKTVLTSAVSLDASMAGVHLVTLYDFTERKRTEMELRIAATAFESQEGMMITDAAEVILRVNHAFTLITGYAAEDAGGQSPRLLKSGRHDAAFFATMWAHIEQDGQWQGEIWNRSPNGGVYLVWLTITGVINESGAVTHYVGTLTDITQRKMAEDEIKHLAFYDPLTELPNRRLLLDRLHQAIVVSARNQQYGALLFIDLDNFKTLNDTHGHDYGDLLLQQAARRLTTCVRESDTVARLGGDEFVVMLEDLSGNLPEAVAQTRSVGEKILEALNQPYPLVDQWHHSTPSIGMTLFSHHQETVTQLLKQADLAMYAAKAAGRNTLRFFEPQPPGQ